MSKAEIRPSADAARPAALFAALGDPTRLALLAALAAGEERSIAILSIETRRRAGVALSRQALTKHLDVMTRAGLLKQRRVGRESRFQVRPEAVADARAYLDRVSAQWDEALGRLKAFVEQ